MTPAVEGLNVVAGLSAMATLWWRRRAPLLIAGLTFVAAAVAPLAAGAAIVSVFTVAQYRRLRVGVLFAVLYLLPGMVGWVVTGSRAMSADAALGAVLFTAGALGWGWAAPQNPDTDTVRFYAACSSCLVVNSSYTSCGVRYPSPEWSRWRLYHTSIYRAIAVRAWRRVGNVVL